MDTTTIYIPTRIGSAEQAEALPEGTPATAEHDFVRERCINGWTGADGRKRYSHAAMIGWTALVPVKVEVEHLRETGGRRRAKTLYVTPWQEPAG